MKKGGSVVAMLWTLLFCTTPVLAQIVRAPFVRASFGKPIMVGGKIQAGEWSDAQSLPMRDGGRFYIKQPGEFVYMAVSLPDNRSGFTDL
jgi:hypothetical protein